MQFHKITWFWPRHYRRPQNPMADTLPSVTIYTDGGCAPNPGPGGWAAVLLHRDESPLEITGSSPATTNNRMELQAAIEALRSLAAPHRVTLFTDSQYLRRGITEWLPGWTRRNWQTRDMTEVKNRDLWEQVALQQQRHRIDWQWVRGHTGDQWNERVDALATGAIARPPLPLQDHEAIHIFTGASCLSKTKQGGWGVILRFREKTRALHGRAADTSGNRMHLTAALHGLRAVKKPLPIHLYTPSSYIRDGARGWIENWEAAGWRTKEGTEVRHNDLWRELPALIQQYRIRWHVISGDTVPCASQEAKLLATEAARNENGED